MSDFASVSEKASDSTVLRLRVFLTAGQTREFDLIDGLTIGRASTNRVVLAADESVDSTHAFVVMTSRGPTLESSSAENHITAGRRSVQQLRLSAGVKFRIGQTDFECVFERSLAEIRADYKERRQLARFDDVIGWMVDACRGLAAVHATGTVHGRVSPTNLRIGRDRHARLSSPLDVSPKDTRAYFAPEQRSDAENIDLRADLYSLGATFYELLTEMSPTAEMRRPASGVNPTVPHPFDGILAKLLSPNPADRFGSAAEVLSALGSAELGGRVLTKSVGLAGSESHMAEGEVPRFAMVVTGAVLGAVVGGGVGVVMGVNMYIGALVGAVPGGLVGQFTKSPSATSPDSRGEAETFEVKGKDR